MIIVGCDFHPSWQQIAIFDAETGEVEQRKLVHSNGEVSCGNSQWFQLLERLGHQV